MKDGKGMRMKKSYLYIGMVIVILSWISNYLYFSLNQLAQPVMLKHYYELPIEEETTFQLHYLMNRNNDVEISSIQIPGLDYVRMIDYGQNLIFRHQQLKTVTVQIDKNMLESNLEKPFVISSIEAYLSNGEKQVYDIGEISLSESSRGPFDFRAAGGSSNGNSFDFVTATEALVINSYEVPFKEQLSQSLKLFINHEQTELPTIAEDLMKDRRRQPPYTDPVEELNNLNHEEINRGIFPIYLKEGGFLNVQHRFEFPENDPNSFHYYRFDTKFIGKTEEGKPFVQRTIMNYDPYFTENNISLILKETRGK